MSLHEIQNTTSEGEQRRRYRLVAVHEHATPGDSQVALLEVVHPDGITPVKWIDTCFLPVSSREGLDFLHAGGAEIPHVLEFEITVRRVQPTPDHVSIFDARPAGAAL